MFELDTTECFERIRNTGLFILDLDGTVYIENELIAGALEFVRCLDNANIQYLFLTNNSSLGTSEYIEKISSMGFRVADKNILTSGQATGAYLSGCCSAARVFVVGTQALKRELALQGHIICDETSDTVDYVVAGFDTELTYQKILAACRYLENGAEFIATNPDLVCPVKDKRYIPDCGSIYKLIENATGKRPFIIGKPHSVMGDIISKRFDIPFSQMAMIGDRLYTDIAFGKNSSIYSICVLSGETSLSDIGISPWKPDCVISSIAFLNGAFK